MSLGKEAKGYIICAKRAFAHFARIFATNTHWERIKEKNCSTLNVLSFKIAKSSKLVS